LLHYLLGWRVGWGVDRWPSFKVRSRVVFPAWSNPSSSNFPVFLYKPVGEKCLYTTQTPYRSFLACWACNRENPGHGGPRWATVGHGGPRWVTVGHGGPRWATVGHGGPRWATVGPVVSMSSSHLSYLLPLSRSSGLGGLLNRMAKCPSRKRLVCRLPKSETCAGAVETGHGELIVTMRTQHGQDLNPS